MGSSIFLDNHRPGNSVYHNYLPISIYKNFLCKRERQERKTHRHTHTDRAEHFITRTMILLQHHTNIMVILSLFAFLYGTCTFFMTFPFEQNTCVLPSEPGSCAMTYTTGAAYARVTKVVNRRGRTSELNYKYNLYRCDQISMRANRNDNSLEMLRGIPVLYVPGHLGDYKQARSLVGLADELGKNRGTAGRLEYFTLDFREEATAFSSLLLEQQAKYVNDAVVTILQLYKKSKGARSHRSVILVGHSMGGFVARRSLQMPNHIPGTVQTIVTLSSPHLKAPHALDGNFAKIWQSTNQDWMMGRHYVLNKALEKTKMVKESKEDAKRAAEEEAEEAKAAEEAEAAEEETAKNSEIESEKAEDQAAESLEGNDGVAAESTTESNSEILSEGSLPGSSNSTGGWLSWLSWGGSNSGNATSTEENALKAQKKAKEAAENTPNMLKARRAATALRNVTLFSIAGGRRDNLMDSDLATVRHLIFPDRGFSILTQDVPGLDISVDHVCATWCKQLMHSITAGLYDAVDNKSGRMHADAEIRVAAMGKHLLPEEWETSRKSASWRIRNGDFETLKNDSIPIMLTSHDHVRHVRGPKENHLSGGSMSDGIINIIRHYGSLLFPIGTAIVCLCLSYQMYVHMASTSDVVSFPTFREALVPENHLLHMAVGVMSSWLGEDIKEAPLIKKQVSSSGAAVVVMLCLSSTPSFTTWSSIVYQTLPNFVVDNISIPSFGNIFLGSDHPPMYAIVMLYCSAIAILWMLDYVLSALQSMSTRLFLQCLRPAHATMPSFFQKMIDFCWSSLFSRKSMFLMFLMFSTLFTCVVGPATRYEILATAESDGGRSLLSWSSLMSPTHCCAAATAALLCMIPILCIVAALTPVEETLESISKKNFLRGLLFLELSVLPLHMPSILVCMDVLRSDPKSIPWDVVMDLLFFRTTCSAAMFISLYLTITTKNGPNKCQSEDAKHMTKYVVGNETFQYDYRTGPPPSVQRGMRLAYWRVAQMKKLDDIFVEANTIRNMLVDHVKVIVNFRRNSKPTKILSGSQGNTTTKAGKKEIFQQGQKVHTLCLGILDKYQKLQISLDGVSSVPSVDDQPPCPLVKARRKFMQREVIKQLSVGDLLKKVTAVMSNTLEKEYEQTDEKLEEEVREEVEKVEKVEKVGNGEEERDIVWPEDTPLPDIPPISTPPAEVAADKAEEKVADNNEEKKNATEGGEDNESSGTNAYFGSEHFDMTAGTMLVVLFFGGGCLNFLWNLTAMYRSLYVASLFSIVLAVHILS